MKFWLALNHHRRFCSRLVVCAAFFFTLFCRTVLAAPADMPVSYREQVLPILMRECSYCHLREERYGYLAIDAEVALDNLVNVPAFGFPEMVRVAPGSPQASYLWLKLTGEHLERGGKGWMMPYQPLPAADLELIRKWIEQGAVDDHRVDP